MFGIDDALIGSAIGGIGSYLGGIGANSAASSAEDKANDLAVKFAKTKYQWTVQDLKAAGLNPALAYSNGPESAGSPNVLPRKSPLEGAVSSALQAAQVKASIENTRADTANKIEQNKSLAEQAKQNLITTKLMANKVPESDLLSAPWKAVSDYTSNWYNKMSAITEPLHSAVANRDASNNPLTVVVHPSDKYNSALPQQQFEPRKPFNR